MQLSLDTGIHVHTNEVSVCLGERSKMCFRGVPTTVPLSLECVLEQITENESTYTESRSGS